MSSWDLFAEVNSILTEMGGKGSGHHGHKGVKGQRGGSAPSGSGGLATPSFVHSKWSSLNAFEKGIYEREIDYDEEYTVDIGGTIYQVKTEGWWSGCLEYRGLGGTNNATVRKNYRDVMSKEAGWDHVDISGYVSSGYMGPSFGVTYIGRESGIKKADFIISQIESQLALSPEGGWVEMGGKGSGNWGHKGMLLLL